MHGLSATMPMCSIVTHPVVPIALSVYLPEGAVSRELVLAGVTCSVIPDLDVIGFTLGIGYDHWLGHRGLTHSIGFSVVLAAFIVFTSFRDSPVDYRWGVIFLFLSTLSHPLLDMLTNGGLGVALFAPFRNTRFFFPWRPIEISPIGFAFVSPWGMRVLVSEFTWVWLPAAAVFFTGAVIRRYG